MFVTDRVKLQFLCDGDGRFTGGPILAHFYMLTGLLLLLMYTISLSTNILLKFSNDIY